MGDWGLKGRLIAKGYKGTFGDDGNVPKQTEEMAAYIGDYMKIH